MVEEFRSRFLNTAKEYCPNDKTAEFVTSYLYSMVVTALARAYPEDEVLQQERESCIAVSTIMDMSFNKSLRDILMFSSHNILIDSIEAAFKSIQGSVRVNKRSEKIQSSLVVSPVVGSRTEPRVPIGQVSSNVASFDEMDLSAIPKYERTRGTGSVAQSSTNEFEADFDMDLEKINSQIPVMFQKDSASKPKDGEFDSDSEDEEEDDLEIGDAGSLNDGSVYDKVPEVHIDLD